MDARCKSTVNQSPRYDAEPWRAADRRKRKPLRKLKPRPERMPAQFVHSVFVEKNGYFGACDVTGNILPLHGRKAVRIRHAPPLGPNKAPGIVERYTIIVAG